MFHQKTPLSPKGDKGVIKPLRYHSCSVFSHGTRASDNGDFRRGLLAFALGPRLPGDIRRARPAALAPCGRLSERQPFRLLILIKASESYVPYIIGGPGICQPFSPEKFHKKRGPPVPRRRRPSQSGRPATEAQQVDPARLPVSRHKRQHQ